MEALFSSLVGGNALRRRVLRVLEETFATGDSRRVDIHVMTFSFTDARIAAARFFAIAATTTSSRTTTVRSPTTPHGRSVAR